ncbi:MAG: ATP-binding protein [Clostridia bacterium]|nr:ATP-binding protein [Clostridia bacterium]
MEKQKPTAFLICGKIAAGKTTYADALCRQRNAVLLSCDELMLTLFGPDAGADHDRLADRVQTYLRAKSLDILATGTDVILDWGFWRREARAEIRRFYEELGIRVEMHCVEVTDAQWQQNVARRNEAVLAGEVQAYYVDEGLAAKAASLFQPPFPEEIDVWIHWET